MARRDIEAGSAYVRIFLKGKAQLQRDTQQVLGGFSKLGTTIAGIGAGIGGSGAAVVGAIAAMTNAFAEAGDQLAKMSARTGIAVEQLSKLKFAAEQSGSSIEDVETGIKRMQAFLDDAATGSDTAAKAFIRLGIGNDELLNMNPSDQFLSIANALSQVADDSTRAALAQDIFGRAGTKLLPLINQGEEGIAKFGEQLEKLGGVMTGEMARNAADVTDAFNEFHVQVMAVVNAIGNAAAPVFTDLLRATQPLIKGIIDFVSANRELIVGILAGGAALTGIGGAITAFGGAMALAAVAASSVITAVSGIAAVISPVAIPLLGAAVAVGGLTTALIGAPAAWLTFTDSGQRALGIMQDVFGKLFEVGSQTIGGIIEALRGGDMGEAMRIASAGVEVAWLEMIDTIAGHWNMFVISVVSDFVAGVDAMIAYVQDNFVSILQAIQNPTSAAAKALVGGATSAGEASGDFLAPLFLDRRDRKIALADARKRLKEELAPGQQRAAGRAFAGGPLLSELFAGKPTAGNGSSGIGGLLSELVGGGASIGGLARGIAGGVGQAVGKLRQFQEAGKQEFDPVTAVRGSFFAAGLGSGAAFGAGADPQDQMVNFLRDLVGTNDDVRKATEGLFQITQRAFRSRKSSGNNLPLID